MRTARVSALLVGYVDLKLPGLSLRPTYGYKWFQRFRAMKKPSSHRPSGLEFEYAFNELNTRMSR
jgi:hypothetical protein